MNRGHCDYGLVPIENSTDGRIVDTILFGLVTPLARMPGPVAALIMIPFQALIHIAVPSVSGQAVLTMPLRRQLTMPSAG